MPPSIQQYPFVRLLAVGRPSVAIFFMLTGFVNSLKPIKLSTSGQMESALTNLAKSCFRRSGRMMLPVIIMTVISWFFCQLGVYRMAKRVESDWIRDTAASQSPNIDDAISRLFKNLLSTWTNGNNDYDKIQWTMTFLLKGSMMCYTFMFATIYARPRARLILLGLIYMYCYNAKDGKLFENFDTYLESTLTHH
jgi:hypothetical protein